MTKHLASLGIVILLVPANFAGAQSIPALAESFNLSARHTPSPQFFLMESRLMLYALDGKPIGTDVYRLRLKSNPTQGGKGGEEYTCARFTWQPRGADEAAIPGLTDWTYAFRSSGQKEKGHLFGIDRSKFQHLVDSTGQVLPADKAYHVYNAFVDFHSFCNVFAEPTTQGRGIQDLKKIGEKIVHNSAFSEPSVSLGSQVLAGSFFRNGEVTLEFKGLSQINGRSCALIGYDSGESSFKMLMKPVPDVNMQTVIGRSHYFGDIHKDLASGWVQRATMTELVVSEITLPPTKINSVIERLIEIRNVSQKEFTGNTTTNK